MDQGQISLSHSSEIKFPENKDNKDDKNNKNNSLSNFWKHILLNYSAPIFPEKQFSATTSRTKKFNRIIFNFDASSSQSMQEFSRQYNSNLFCFFYLNLIETLSKLADQQDIAITTLIYSPSSSALNINTSPLLLRYKLNPKLSFCEQFNQATLSVFQAYEHKDSNLEMLLAQLNLNSPELFQIMISVTDQHSRNMIYLPCKETVTTPFSHHHPQAEISFSLQYTEEGIQGELCYNENRYEAKFIEQLLECFKRNLQENLQYFDK